MVFGREGGRSAIGRNPNEFPVLRIPKNEKPFPNLGIPTIENPKFEKTIPICENSRVFVLVRALGFILTDYPTDTRQFVFDPAAGVVAHFAHVFQQVECRLQR